MSKGRSKREGEGGGEIGGVRGGGRRGKVVNGEESSMINTQLLKVAGQGTICCAKYSSLCGLVNYMRTQFGTS